MVAADSSAQVLIVGAGPVGQLAALLLSQHGIRSLLVDKRLTTLGAPKAHAINARTLEICDSIGVSAERLRELGASANDGGEVRFMGTLTGAQGGTTLGILGALTGLICGAIGWASESPSRET